MPQINALRGDRVAEAVKLYAGGLSLFDVSLAMSVSETAVRNAFAKAGVPTRSKRQAIEIGTESLRETINAHVRICRETGCWQWTGKLSPAGYGRLIYRQRCQNAHRWSHEAFIGPIPAGMRVVQVCGNRGCANPKHLELWTGADIMARAKEMGTVSRGPMHAAKITSGVRAVAKLNMDKAREIRRRRAAGERGEDLAAEMGVTASTIARVVANEIWREPVFMGLPIRARGRKDRKHV